MKRIKVIVILTAMVVLISFVAAGCRTMAGMKDEPLGEGEKRIFSADYNQVLKATQEAIPAVGLQMEETTEIKGDTWMILARESSSMFSYGTLVRIVVVKLDNNQAEVRVVTKRKGALNIGATGDFSQQLFSAINLKLARK